MKYKYYRKLILHGLPPDSHFPVFSLFLSLFYQAEQEPFCPPGERQKNCGAPKGPAHSVQR